MSSISASDLDRWREFVALVRRRLEMYTVGGSLLEVSALLVGFDNGLGPGVLGGFQEWMSSRHPDHPEYAFVGLAFEESGGKHLPDVSIETLGLEESQVAAAKLLDLMDEYLTRTGSQTRDSSPGQVQQP
jgi:hypothetical protein